MKTIYILIPAVIFCSCMGTKFTYVPDSDVEAYGDLMPFNINSTYELYVRQVVRLEDAATKTYRLANAETPDGKNVVEIEYMLISKTDNRVIILNNIPSIYQGYGGRKNKSIERSKSYNLADTDKEIEIDIWYLRQFRFGRIDQNSNLEFVNVDGTSKNHIWKISEEIPGTIRLNSISVADKYGEVVRNIKEAFELEVVFKKVNSFRLVFRYKENGTVKNSYGPKDQTFYVSKKTNRWNIIFRFDMPVNGSGTLNNIVFTKDRMYAPPAD